MSSTSTHGHQTWSHSEAEQQVIDLELQPREFTILWKGGSQFNNFVQGIIFQSGRKWSNGKTWKRVVFPQSET
jgi:hypothetical protein